MPRCSPLATLVVSIVLSPIWAAPTAAQTTAQRARETNSCAAKKTAASGDYMGAVIDCQPRVVRHGDGADDRCVLRAARQLTQRFAAIERADGCETVNDAPAVIARIDAIVDNVVALLDMSNANRCLRRQLFAMGRDAERQTRCVAEAISKGAGHSVDPACQTRASDRFFAEFERASAHGCTGDAVAIDTAIRAAASLARNGIKPPVTTCAPVEITAMHGPNITGNSRLATIEDGQVACMHADAGTIANCAFVTISGRQSGEWLESPQGNFALVGQAIALDGRPGGEYVIAARVSDAVPPACVEPAGMDTMGRTASGSELAAVCIVEDMFSEYNAKSAEWGWTPMWNFADREVCTSNNPATNPHPDGATLVRSYSQSGTGPDDTFCYTGLGAALNDLNGAERDWLGQYYVGDGWCHHLHVAGIEVPAAKRPATFSLPAPGRINTRSPILWRPVNPNIAIANGGTLPAAQTFDNLQGFRDVTGATLASGALPDLGVVGTSVTIGSITFSLALGGDTMAVGAGGTPAAPDWYPDLPGNDIALGYENLQLQFAGPVTAFGFEFVEPNLTMPSLGGTPVDSTFEIVMYRGAAEVGRVTFNAQDDEVGFFGVWSQQPFDRVTIVDQTGNDDDEFFGRFFVGTRPIP